MKISLLRSLILPNNNFLLNNKISMSDFELYDTILDYDPENSDPVTNPLQYPSVIDPYGAPVFKVFRTIKKSPRIYILTV